MREEHSNTAETTMPTCNKPTALQAPRQHQHISAKILETANNASYYAANYCQTAGRKEAGVCRETHPAFENEARHSLTLGLTMRNDAAALRYVPPPRAALHYCACALAERPMHSWQYCKSGTVRCRQPHYFVIMEQWNCQQRVFALKMFYKNNYSLEGVQREFRRYFNVGQTGSALKNKPTGRQKRARTPHNIEGCARLSYRADSVSVLQSPQLSIRKQHAATMMQELKENDHRSRLEFCQHMTNINEDNAFLNKLWMSYEAHFHLTDCVSKQNYRYWADSNLKYAPKRPSHSVNVTFTCAVSLHRVIGPSFSENEERITPTVNSDQYVDMLRSYFCTYTEQFSTTLRSLVSTG
ncbi:hypothetical protein PR048_002623 [Dryococelus australis]|uniref:DUF4817 domain-containing protein n=1 Tax=Dryococelus australis TaxID=614101 RepID=A0ABQ9ILF2_9NEOP|nr:hypothetical protein PR048_002623 [Dryococelus australis]